MNSLLNKLRNFSLKRTIKKILKGIETDLMDNFLELLLKMIRLVLCLNRKYRRNIEGFDAVYVFQSLDGEIAASAIFKKNKMKVKKYALDNANVTVVFRDGKALWEFLMSGDPDVLGFMLSGKLSYEGNFNYLMKFAYMAKHLTHMFGI